LIPIGLETVFVESLTSYIIRLAEAHSVQTGMLVRHEIAPLMSVNSNLNKERYLNQGSNQGGIDKIFANAAKSFNGMGEWTISLIQILESLTSVQNLSHLTFLNSKEVLSRRNLLKKQRAWCASCFTEWKNTQQTIYEPLIWNLEIVKLCPRHETFLLTKCPHCDKNNKILGWKSRVGYCSSCSEWLGILNKENYDIPINKLESQRQIIHELSNLITSIPNLLYCPCRTIISFKLNDYIQTFTDINKATFARYLGVSNTVLGRWCAGENMPDIVNLLNICHKLDVSLIDFVTRKDITISDQLIQNIRTHKLSKGHTKSSSSRTPIQ